VLFTLETDIAKNKPKEGLPLKFFLAIPETIDQKLKNRFSY